MVQVDDVAPNFTLLNQAGEPVTLADLRGRWVLLYWYPKAATPGCTAQAEGLRDQRRAFAEYHCTVLGASFDRVDELAPFHADHSLSFDLLSDADRKVGPLYGVAGDDGTAGYASRHSFLIDPAGVVRRRYEVTEPGFHAEDVLADLDQLTSF